jgi:hypothetical protein
LISSPLLFKECCWSFTNALCISIFHLNNEFNRSSILLTQSNFIATGTVSLNLYECAVSASNADLTL